MNTNQTAHRHGTSGLRAAVGIDTNINRLFINVTGSNLNWSSNRRYIGATGESATDSGLGDASRLLGEMDNATVTWASSTVTTYGGSASFNKNTLNTNQIAHSHGGTTGGMSANSTVSILPTFLQAVYIVRVF
jgi:hypothetical protein